MKLAFSSKSKGCILASTKMSKPPIIPGASGGQGKAHGFHANRYFLTIFKGIDHRFPGKNLADDLIYR